MRRYNNIIKKNFLGFFIICFVFFLDRSSKALVMSYYDKTGDIYLRINSFLNLNLIWNEGIAFGIFSFEEKYYYNFLTIFIFLIIIIIFWLMLKSPYPHKLGYALIIGGSFGNITDRLFYSSVIDFIDLNYKGFHWFVFNVADIFITLGVLILIFLEFKVKT